MLIYTDSVEVVERFLETCIRLDREVAANARRFLASSISSSPGQEEVARYEADWMPERVIAEADAKLQIVDIAARIARNEEGANLSSAGRQILTELLTPYKDRPGYDQGWFIS